MTERCGRMPDRTGVKDRRKEHGKVEDEPKKLESSDQAQRREARELQPRVSALQASIRGYIAAFK